MMEAGGESVRRGGESVSSSSASGELQELQQIPQISPPPIGGGCLSGCTPPRERPDPQGSARASLAVHPPGAKK